ncbi:hypothetical protein HBR94_15365 [Pseudomonas sp. WS 5412]|uniref:hypothetical protein n=1 Tax=Pseudomonas sp. WS 5412 TaxID=2717487 RepID=UPI0014756E86|nr:hypothetical protein [Pseudomonas sp. WS 5412]NMY32876.1 hypothetical protein [Pseudomonas sp. WS 5412]
MPEPMVTPRRTFNFAKMKSPRSHANSEAPGSYNIATTISKTVINAGEKLTFEQYITGYGEISDAKIQCYISSDIFSSETSLVKCGLGLENEKDLAWGNTEQSIEGDGFRMTLDAISVSHWDKSTVFVDASERMNSVITEMRYKNPPFTYILNTKKKAKSGIHYIDFYLTFFNGREWITNKERVEFKIRNLFEKYTTPISGLAIVASVSAIAKIILMPIGKWIISLF